MYELPWLIPTKRDYILLAVQLDQVLLYSYRYTSITLYFPSQANNGTVILPRRLFDFKPGDQAFECELERYKPLFLHYTVSLSTTFMPLRG